MERNEDYYREHLVRKQFLLAKEYVLCNNGTEAYLKVYPTNNRKTAGNNFNHIFRTNLAFREFVTMLQKQAEREVDVSLADVVREEKCLAYSDIRRLFSEEGTPLAPHELPEDIARAVASFEIFQKDLLDSDGNVYATETTYKYKLWSKPNSIERLEKHLGFFEKDNLQKKQEIVVHLED